MTKYIVVVGGVISGVGKGVATASLGKIMQEYGFSVTAIKIDPYINCDAGTLRPTEHGEVWVTDDGGEIDQDLGNYERFLGIRIPKKNNITTGQIYKSLIEKERRGEFLGQTVDFIPHVPDEIKRRIKESSEGYDITMIEIGGTIGEDQNIPFLFALKSLENEIGKENLMYILVTYMPIPSHLEEMKTKPTQLSVKLLRQSGISPDLILCRGKKHLDNIRKRKIEIYANIPQGNVISMPDVTGKGTPNTIYVIPLDLEKEEVGRKIISILHLEKRKNPDWTEWENYTNKLIYASNYIKVGIIGKYLNIGNYKLEDSYISIKEALKHAAAHNNTELEIEWIDSRDFEQNSGTIEKLKEFKGIIVPGGFGNLGVEGKIKAIQFCRENNIPYLGLCYGMQLAVIEFARNICKLNAGSTEIEPDIPHPVIDILPEQKDITDKGGTMRLGAYNAILKIGTKTFSAYGKEEVSERHRHRYEVNPEYYHILEEKGLVISGTSKDKRLVEFIEIPNHKFFIATQAHPEFKSSLLSPAPLFREFVKACLE